MTENCEEDKSRNNDPQNDDEELMIKEKYFESLRNWLHQYRLAQANSFLPYYYLFYQLLSQSASSRNNQSPNNYQTQNNFPFFQLPQNNNERPTGTQENNIPAGAVEFVIPPLWKRFLAEILDAIIVFIAKIVYYYISDYLLGNASYRELLGYSIFHAINLMEKIAEDSDINTDIMFEILIFELINRFIACFMETLFLSDSLGGPPWGATPGKLIMGLKVVTATNVVPIENRPRETVLVYPAEALTFKTAFIRSLVKNVLITFAFPMCLLTFLFQHGRTTYDIVANVIVVESNVNLILR